MFSAFWPMRSKRSMIWRALPTGRADRLSHRVERARRAQGDAQGGQPSPARAAATSASLSRRITGPEVQTSIGTTRRPG